MSAEKPKHDYHLVDPSPWPIYVSFATLILAFGAVYYFHSKALWLLLIGFALVVYGAFMWWRDCLLYTSPSPRDKRQSRMPSSA